MQWNREQPCRRLLLSTQVRNGPLGALPSPPPLGARAHSPGSQPLPWVSVVPCVALSGVVHSVFEALTGGAVLGTFSGFTASVGWACEIHPLQGLRSEPCCESPVRVWAPAGVQGCTGAAALLIGLSSL